MSVEAAAPIDRVAIRSGSAAPALTPVRVAAYRDVEPALRAARAEVASLGLKVRGAARKAEMIETEADELEAANADGEARARFDAEVAAYRRELDDAFAARRRELDADLADAVAEADATVEAARAEARSIVGPATDQLQRLLRRISGSSAGPDAGPPPPLDGSAPRDDADRSAAPVIAGTAVAAPVSDAPTPVDVGARVVIEPEGEVEPVILPPPAAVVAPVDPTVPSVPDGPVDAPASPPAPVAPYLAYVLPPQDPSATSTIYPAGPPMMMPGSPMMMPGSPMMIPGQPMMMPGMTPAGMATPPMFPAEPVERESPFRRVWHLDVMAPIIAVLIVLAILAAWVL